MYNFQAYLIYSPRFPEVQVTHFTSQVRLYFVEKRKPKIFRFKNVIERGRRKCLTFVIRQISSKNFRENILKPLLFRKDLSSPRMTEQIQIFQRQLKGLCHGSPVHFV